MNEVGCLKQSLLEAREETRRLPEWVKQLITAREAYYGPRDSKGPRGDAVITEAAKQADSADVGSPPVER